MSRIGSAPIPVPGGVDISIDGATVKVKGPKGELSQDVPERVTVRQDGSHFDRVGATWFWNAWLGRAVASAFPGPTASG